MDNAFIKNLFSRPLTLFFLAITNPVIFYWLKGDVIQNIIIVSVISYIVLVSLSCIICNVFFNISYESYFNNRYSLSKPIRILNIITILHFMGSAFNFNYFGLKYFMEDINILLLSFFISLFVSVFEFIIVLYNEKVVSGGYYDTYISFKDKLCLIILSSILSLIYITQEKVSYVEFTYYKFLCPIVVLKILFAISLVLSIKYLLTQNFKVLLSFKNMFVMFLNFLSIFAFIKIENLIEVIRSYSGRSFMTIKLYERDLKIISEYGRYVLLLPLVLLIIMLIKYLIVTINDKCHVLCDRPFRKISLRKPYLYIVLAGFFVLTLGASYINYNGSSSVDSYEKIINSKYYSEIKNIDEIMVKTSDIIKNTNLKTAKRKELIKLQKNVSEISTNYSNENIRYTTRFLNYGKYKDYIELYVEVKKNKICNDLNAFLKYAKKGYKNKRVAIIKDQNHIIDYIDDNNSISDTYIDKIVKNECQTLYPYGDMSFSIYFDASYKPLFIDN